MSILYLFFIYYRIVSSLGDSNILEELATFEVPSERFIEGGYMAGFGVDADEIVLCSDFFPDCAERYGTLFEGQGTPKYSIQTTIKKGKKLYFT